jgi:hypothetical protein
MTRLALLFLVACSDSSAPAEPATPVVKCSAEAKVRCDCDVRDAPSAGDTACSPTSLGLPALCCSDEGFAKDKNGGCSCVALRCERSAIECRCGPATSTNAERVEFCSKEVGRVCCLDSTKRRCTCSGESCSGTIVPDCTVDRIGQTCEAQFTTYRSVVTSCRD